VVGCRSGLKVLGRVIGALGDEKEVEVFKRDREAMQGHLIESVFADEKKAREKGIVRLLGE
jgi:hypothetical protein